ncbi:TMV resistance protein N isoform X2 [Eucalyptus grandis]|uniref:TMV resistance protein N isoform X2 n=1 Tax=Eucalyptus grandis TaxID=71139 RepID=UPI00192F0BA3|nr:TMV resistance protein N isoform X2 [Eucalyptus grandis]
MAKKRRHEAEAATSGVEPATELLGGGGGPRDDEPKKRSGKKKRREGSGHPRDGEPKKRSGKKKKRREDGGGEGGGESSSIIDDAQSYELATRVGYQVVGSPLKIQEMEKPVGFDYDVFLNFRGPDTRRDIADCLYSSLTDFGIRAFRDNEELHVGKEIGPELLQAIKQSKISIPIFSIRYAESEWCLMELVQMVECKEKWGQEIMPIFYEVKPSEVRDQKEAYGTAIQSHRDKRLYKKKTIRNWTVALNKVGNLKGWELKESGKGEFTKKVVQELLIKLKKNYVAVSDYLVEMDDHVDEIMELIGERIIETKVVGIHGMGGVGKTTLATIIYNKLSAHSTNCCFLSDCKDKEVAILQKQLIFDILKESVPIRNRAEGITAIKERLSSKKVVLLLDDVMEKTQLDALVGMGKCWFDRGSKVIITTRDEEVLKHVDVKYKLTEMDFNHSLILFSRHAFNNDHPPAEYFDLSKNAVNICGRLPLALEIIGSLLAKEDRNFWGTTLKKLKSIPDKGVEKRLNINIEALDQPARKIFLDVCCFFVGFDVRIVSHMWESYGFHPRYYLHILQKMSLIEITKHKQLWMHDIIRDIGQNFVRKNADYKPEKQSRVWDHEKLIDVLEIKEGRENVEAICLRFDRQFQDFIEKEESIGLSKLRFLQVDCVDLDESNGQHFPSTNLCQRNPIMLPNLIMLSWHNFPVYFKFTTICFKKLMILDLSRSQITDEWEGWNHLKMTKNLKVLNLTGCGNLHRTLDLSAHENLEQLILQGCTKLVEVHRSIGMLKHLVLLNLKYCEKLQTLPDEMEEMEDLRELLLDGTSITKIPEWNGMKKLETLSAASCRLLSELPLGNFGSLVKLDLSYSSIRELPDSIETMKNLRILRIFDSMLEKLPSALGKLERLEEFYANSYGCLSGENPSEIGRLSLEKLEKIHASSCRYLSGEIPSEIGKLSFLRILMLSGTRIFNIPKLLESLTELVLTNNLQMRCPNLSNLINLRVLTLKLEYQSPSHPTPSLNWIGGLRKLESLGLYCDDLVTLPLDFNLLSKLRKLQLLANNLECLPKLPQNLSYFHFDGRGLMEKSINLSYWEKLSELKLSYCEQLKEIRSFGTFEKPAIAYSLGSSVAGEVAHLTGLKKLQHLWINDCPKLVEVRGQQESLGSFLLERCQSLEQLPDPLSFKHIQVYIIRSCRKVKEIQGPETSENLGWLQLADLPLLEKLPDLTNAKELRLLFLECCPHLVEIPEDVIIKECERLEETLESDEYGEYIYVKFWRCSKEERSHSRRLW